jgi:hypothetical protein
VTGPGRVLAGIAVGLWITAGVARGASGEDAEDAYDVIYEVRISPAKAAVVRLQVTQEGGLLRELRFELAPDRMYGFEAPGEVRRERGELVWRVPEAGGTLRYVAEIDHLRDPAEYDARCTERWALFRGTDLIPPILATAREGAHARARIRFRMPPGWRVVTPFEEIEPRVFRIEQRDRRLDTPRGWMIAGEELRILRAEIGEIGVVLAAPEQHEVRERDRLALLRWTLPALQEIVGARPRRLVIVSADDPMWRGGLSGPDSMYLHAERPLIGDDGTSPLLHELIHVAMAAVPGENGDWIVEGLAELYSIELLSRSGTISADEAEAAFEGIRDDARAVDTLRVEHAAGAVTDRAVVVLHGLDALIRQRTDGAASLDDVLRRFVRREDEPVTPRALREHAEAVAGSSLDDFFAGHVD